MRFPRLLAICFFGPLVSVALEASLLAIPQDAPGSTTVYVTKTGIRYHQTGCRFLGGSSIPIATWTRSGCAIGRAPRCRRNWIASRPRLRTGWPRIPICRPSGSWQRFKPRGMTAAIRN